MCGEFLFFLRLHLDEGMATTNDPEKALASDGSDLAREKSSVDPTAQPLDHGAEHLKRALSSRQVSMIAIVS